VIAWRRAPAPPGYTREWRENDTEVVALRTARDSVLAALSEGTLYGYAEHAPNARSMQGRTVAYAVQLPDGGPDVVVRHSRHGGLLAGITGDRFLGPTRAPRELHNTLRLARLGIPTPELVAYATYPAGGPWRRADVVTREIRGGRDFGTLLLETLSGHERAQAWAAVARLLRRMTAGGVRHPDLNAANILLAPDENDAVEAWLLDVDRVWFDEPAHPRVLEANLRRLMRSLRKWRDQRGANIEDSEMHALARDARSAAT
jgi:3-deoxy-D-manno-octulosonic acid kinase